MKKFLFVLALLVGSFATQAQDFKKIKLADLDKIVHPKGDKIYVVNFWATWCRPCIKELPYFERLQKKYADKNVKVILLAVEDAEQKVKIFIKKKKIQSQVYLLTDAKADQWVPKVDKDWDGAIPVTLFINGKTKKREFHMGDMTEAELNKKVESIVKQTK